VNPQWKKRILPPAIIVGCGLIAGALISLGGSAEKTPPEIAPMLVETIVIQPKDTTAVVRATGVLKPARQVAIVPQVGGRIVEVSDQLMPGGRVTQGDVIAMIEQRDFLAAHAQAQAQLRQAELNLALERGRAATAEREWGVLSAQGDAPERTALATRQPHLEAAEAQVRAAKGGVRQAEGNLSRTRLRAPFNAVIVDENLDVGQVVGPGAPVATLVGTDTLWVTVSIPVSDLTDLDLPSGASPGSPVEVIHRLSEGRKVTHQGRLLKLGGQLEPQTRQAQLTVAVDQPFDTDVTSLPLLPGTHVEVAIQGRAMPQAYRVPRASVHDGNQVWVVQDDALAVQEVTISTGDADTVVISEGLAAGTHVVTSPLALPTVGQPVQIINHSQSGEE
jgi:RND family efflux transporter MFP subunit